jgi:hypothetical protein
MTSIWVEPTLQATWTAGSDGVVTVQLTAALVVPLVAVAVIVEATVTVPAAWPKSAAAQIMNIRIVFIVGFPLSLTAGLCCADCSPRG